MDQIPKRDRLGGSKTLVILDEDVRTYSLRLDPEVVQWDWAVEFPFWVHIMPHRGFYPVKVDIRAD